MKLTLPIRMSLWICSVVFLLLLGAAAAGAHFAYSFLGRYLDEKAASVAASTASSLDKVFLQTRSMAVMLAAELSSRELTPDDMPQYMTTRLRAAYAECPHIIGLAVAYLPGFFDKRPDYNAYILLRQQDQEKLLIWRDEKVDYDKYRDWFAIPVNQERSFWTSPFVSVAGMLISSFSTPFYRTVNGRRELAGVVVCDYDVGAFVNNLRTAVLPVNTKVQTLTLLMNPFGKILASPRREQILHETLFSLLAKHDDPPAEDWEHARAIFGRGTERDGPTGSGRLSFSGTGILSEPCDVFYHTCVNKWVVAVAIPSDWRAGILSPLFFRFFIGVLAALGLIVLIIVIICRRLSRPLAALAQAAENVGQGNFTAALPPATGGVEIEELHKAFGKMQTALAEHIEKLEESIASRERTEGELNAAKAIQQDILPHILPPFAAYLNVTSTGTLIPARGVGGDLYDVFPVDGERLALIIGDVSGKGIPAALFMTITQTLQRNIAASAAVATPSDLVERLNAMVSVNNETSMFVTYWVCFLNTRTGEMQYTNCGHNPPLIRRHDGTIERLHTRHGPPIGIVPEHKYSDSTAWLAPGDMLVCYTDGVTEATNSASELFGEDRLRKTISAGHQTVHSMIKDVVDAVFAFTGEAEQFDDVTLLITRFSEHQEEAKKEAQAETETPGDI